MTEESPSRKPWLGCCCGPTPFGDAEHVVAEHRRNVLGWLVKEGRLEIKVGVPVDPATGRPYRLAEATKYFHSKYGIFTDCTDPADRVAFIGSDNETWQGWVGNHETFAACAHLADRDLG